jgi:hypothetical protein
MNNVLVIYDNLTIDNQFISDRLDDLTNFYYNQPQWRVITTSDIDGMLRKIAASGATDYVIVNAKGHYFRHGDHNELVKISQQTGAPLVGHIIARNGYYSIDAQYFCLNMAVYSQLGQPSLLQTNGEVFTSVATERSVENFHDDYTPYWVKPIPGTTEYRTGVREFGSKLVQLMLEAGHTIQNIPQEIRNRKHYLYPNTNATEIEAFFKDYTYQPTELSLVKYFEAIRKYFEDERRSIYVLSTEPVLTTSMPPQGLGPEAITNVGHIDFYVGVCGALKTIPLLYKNGFDSNTKVNLIDISTAALEYQRYLRENWDGDLANYETVHNTFRMKYPLDYIYCWKSWNSWDSELKSFIDGCQMTTDEFKTAWQTYLTCDVKFNEVNLMNPDEVTNFITNAGYHGTSYTWVSNAYLMEHTTAAYGSEWLAERYLHLVKLLKTQPGRVFVERNNQLELLSGPRQG